ncbi:hypothetical protein CMMCAS08_11125 [Clavibacter michiganensis subsp. michiganensis]|nr:DUF4145 domain-containing protein [Clavibacter michiganensis]OUD90640.1 hypothetical protein CMMCAS05_11200 [Clavibacter michiganensis subsp. michiganensis]OUE03254.1 hypothetical protein CMMCAS08_11125 [Clavibacter michiganensis subsp. michiganensis]OUE14234.1 hypothetical protein CMMCAY01_14620 [Clavibacter michiganensis subsp. michiganensis]
MSYVEHPIRHMDIRSLHLDVSNYRFAADQPSETAALNYLWAEEDVADIAELILRDGYVDNEQPLVVVEAGRHVVVEGNRRVSALMALNDPSLAPAHQAAIERLLRRFALEAENLPQSIRVMELPDRASAAAILARLHIGTTKKGWSLDEQAKFVMAQFTDDVTLGQLSSLLPGIENVGRLVRMGSVRAALRATSFDDEALTKYAHGARLRMSSFEYAYRQAAVQELIGLSFDAESRVSTWAQAPDEHAALSRLLQGFKAGELNTRRGLIPGTAAFTNLLHEMGAAGATPSDGDVLTADDRPVASEGSSSTTSPVQPPSRDGAFHLSESTEQAAGASDAHTEATVTQSAVNESVVMGGAMEASDRPDSIDSGIGPQSADAEAEAEAEAGSGAEVQPAVEVGSAADGEGNRRGPNDPLTRSTIALTGIDELAQPVTMQRRLRELRRINVNDFPAAAAMLMRSVLEAAIKEHYGQSNGIDVTGELGQVMRQVRTDYQRNGQLANAVNLVSQFGNDATHVPGTGRWFNMITHSVNVDVNGRQVQEAWLVVLPLVRFLLLEPSRTSA